MAMYMLDNTIQKYAWGSRVELPEFLGRANPSGEPWAELWMGAHPKAPSMVIDQQTGARHALDSLIAGDPVAMLGQSTAERFSNQLPFLLKVLTASKPLSIQAHPSKRKAEHGFAREEVAGIPLNAPERNYKDPNHKPETIVAMTQFRGLCGFRPIEAIIENVRLLSDKNWERSLGRLVKNPGKLELSVFLYSFFSALSEQQERKFRYIRLRSERIVRDEGRDSPTGLIFSTVLALMDEYPDDLGTLAPLVLNLFELQPGQGLNLMAGDAHAYLSGMGVEIMANSDNVLRGGLTHKHVDIPELFSVLGFDSYDIEPIIARPGLDGFLTYHCDVPDYSLGRAIIRGRLMVHSRPLAPEILLCTAGAVSVRAKAVQAIELPRGASVFIPASERDYELAGDGEVFRASVPA
ncbi:MAG TPA: mannose-6-phosphate isomerase, class I [bacterium]|nr:mannose-6-phosphate isomerase, class I [bacterium]